MPNRLSLTLRFVAKVVGLFLIAAWIGLLLYGGKLAFDKWMHGVVASAVAQASRTSNSTTTGKYRCDAVVVRGNKVLLGEGSYRSFLDVSDPANPILLGKVRANDLVTTVTTTTKNPDSMFDAMFPTHWAMTSTVMKGVLTDSVAFVACLGSSKSEVIEISNPAHPEFATPSPFPKDEGLLGARGNLAYVIAPNRLMIYDITNPAKPLKVGECKVEEKSLILWGSSYSDRLVCIPKVDNFGIYLFDVSVSTSPQFLGTCVTRKGAWLTTISGSRLFAAGGEPNDTSIIEIFDLSDPRSPVKKGAIKVSTSIRKIAASDSLLFVASDKSGLKIFDVSDPGKPLARGEFAAKGGAWDVAVSGSLVYVAAGEEGLQILDVSKPAKPVVRGSYKMKDYNWSVTLDPKGNIVSQSP